MAWHIGIDEAGYGPNLGPLVMSVVACRTNGARADLWRRMRGAVRRHGDKDDGRPLVADSKVVYTAGKGLHPLEIGVLGFLCGGGRLNPDDEGFCILNLVENVCAGSLSELRQEPWFKGTTPLPRSVTREGLERSMAGWRRSTEKSELYWGLATAVLVAPQRFNGLVDKWGSKGAVLGLGLVELLEQCLLLPGADSLEIVVDKHGGRNTYSSMLQQAFADGVVLAREEGAECSHYEVVGLGREVCVTFRPRADATAFCVALASMVCKYLREVLMEEFNRFWLDKLPGLAPTAGYPGDSQRFYDAIEPELVKLGIAKESVWRGR